MSRQDGDLWAGTGQRARRPRLDAAAKDAYGTAFGRSAELYHRIRPAYPDPVYGWAEGFAREASVPVPGACVDVGAGTGLFGAGLRARGWEVLGVDPDPALLELHPTPTAAGTAEALPLAEGSASLITVAQAWHWFDPEAASAEFRRVLRRPGAVVIVLNQLDVRIEWVLRLSRIMHAGDVYRPQWRPELTGFGPVRAAEFRFSTPGMTVGDLVALAATRTYWLRGDERTRARVEGNLREFLTGEGRELALASGHATPGHAEGEPVVYELPYVCLAYAASLS
ncbi:class I SAM-dependent methyltransferase [Brevibacterium album]|uniref:class I SAM-dependent methyltransferase n=1 Tax=Brevibacterium album TaxID=417948 RepID=UPI000413251F|nr:class I SAM-dependent methyltransferase [Brevibacterium album]